LATEVSDRPPYFICNDEQLTAMKPYVNLPLEPVLDNMRNGPFSLDVHKVTPLSYIPGEEIKVTLISHNNEISIKQFVMVAREATGLDPVGQWDVARSEGFAQAGNCAGAGESSMAYEADPEINKPYVNLVWTAPDMEGTIEFAASVIATNGNVYSQIRSAVIVPYDKTEGEESVHYDPREFQEEEEDENEEVDPDFDPSYEEREEEEEDREDPDEGRRVLEEMEEESLRRDLEGGEEMEEGEERDNGARMEEMLKIKEEQRQRQMLLEEEQESEVGDWMQEKLREAEEKEEEYQNELMEYERAVAEEDKQRLEMIKWEIKDKEEHDKIMWDEQQERQKNRTPKKEENKETEAIIQNEEIIIIKESSGAGMVTASVAMVTVAAILKFFF